MQGKAKLFSGEVEGLAVQLSDWVYPVVADLATGQLKFDDFGGRWGERTHLDRFLQMYAVEKAKIEARKRGHQCTEQTLADGSVKLTIQVRRCHLKTIEIVISTKGETTVTTRGFAGASCRDASKALEEALGQRTGEQLTAEFHQAQVVEQQQRA